MRLVVPCLLASACGRIGFASGELTLDGAPADVAFPDGPPPVAVSCDVSRPGALLCESFEAPDVAWDYTVFEQGLAVRSTANAANGGASLEATIDGSDNFKAARWGLNSVLPNITTGELYLREWIFLPSSTVVTDQLSILVAGNRTDPFPSVNLLLRPGSAHVIIEGSDIPHVQEFPRDRWVCVELDLDVGASGRVELRLDGVVAASEAGIDTQVAGGFTSLDAGIHYATPMQRAARMFVDEVVADTSPIGCD